MASSTTSGISPETPDQNGNSRSLSELREMIVGPQQRELARLRERLDDPNLRAEDMSQIVAEAIAIRAKRDRAMLRTLQPMIEESLKLSVARDPKFIADALYPIIGQAVRKAVAHSLRGMVESLNHILERSFSWDSLKWRVEALRTGKSFGEIALMRSLRFRVEEAFLIHRETGLLLSHAAATGAVVQDTDLVSGMLTAVQDFVRDSFAPGKSEELETMQVGEYTVWVLHGPLALLAGVVSGAAPPDLRNIFQRTLERVHAEFGNQLQHFSGDSQALSGAQPLLHSCLLGSQSKAVTRSYRWVWPVTALALLIIALTFFLVRQQLRWNHYVEHLRAEPGIILASEESHWNSFSVVGLRDPLSPDPELLLRRSGIDPQKVASRWEPYSSLDPVFATARKLLNSKEAIEQQVIRFSANSATLEPSELAKVDVLAAQINFMRRQAPPGTATPITIEITGHTDRTGREAANALLSQHRAEEVRKALTERGVPAVMLNSQGVGASRPALAPSDSYLEDLNRRVTVTVNLPPLKVQR
jgi:outer membrane protein OmpA-like peptidoglycan-associated protein